VSSVKGRGARAEGRGPRGEGANCCLWVAKTPREVLGGVPMLAISPPFNHTGVRFMPTGGTNLGNLDSYLG